MAGRWAIAAVTLLLAVAWCAFVPVAADEGVFVCGGFVTLAPHLLGTLASSDVDFSAVRVKLYSSSGFLKHETNSGENGYFFVPIYDTDTYTLQIESADGWSFAATSHTMEPDASGAFACEDDITFAVTGFRVAGTVDGAEGVTVVLASDRADRKDVSVKAAADGSVTFDNVAPGEYKATAQHPVWTMDLTPQVVVVRAGNANIPRPFSVLGYDVRGTVDSPFAGVQVLVYTEGGVDAACAPVATDAALPAQSPTGFAPACAATVDSDGAFVLEGVPAGTHTFVPVVPTKAPVTVDPSTRTVAVQGSTTLPPFAVVGLTLSGRVLRYDGDAAGIADVEVALRGTRDAVATTTSDGTFTFHSLTPGTYTLQASAAHIAFAAIPEFRISAASTTLPNILASKFDVCGSVMLADVPASLNLGRLLPRKVNMQASGGDVQEGMTDADGQFCFQAAPGAYSVMVPVSSAERAAGLVLSPAFKAVDVDAAVGAVAGVDFVPSQMSVRGSVSCLAATCDDGLTVTIASQAGDSPPRTAKWLPDAKDGAKRFTFDGVWPGRYEVVVDHESGSLCWDQDDSGAPVESTESRSRVVVVTESDVDGVTFVQTGFVMTINSDHDLMVQAAHAASTTELHVQQGSTHTCVAQPGTYTITAGDCFKFRKKSYTFNTKKRSPVELAVTKYRVRGMLTTEADEGIDAGSIKVATVVVRDDGSGKPKKRRLSVKPADGGLAFKTTAPPGSTLTITPTAVGDDGDAPALMFYPPSFTFHVGAARCPPQLPATTVRRALFLQGTVSPPLAGVNIDVSIVAGSGVLPDGSEPAALAADVAQTQSDEEGRYRVGPLHPGLAYALAASKPGYFFESTAQDGVAVVGATGVDFVHRRLGSATVTAIDEDGEPVPGVVLSVSRERHRYHNATNADGSFTFSSLFPGSYMVRPVLKEYTFAPLSITVDVEEGGDHSAQFVATRVAFSCFGVVQSLNGVPEAGVVVTAVAADAPMEETTTDAVGKYRLRGLKPGAKYTISVRAKRDGNKQKQQGVQTRSSPPETVVTMGSQDRVGVDFVLLHEDTRCTVTATVAMEDRWLDKQAKAIIALAASPARSVATAKLTASRFVEFKGLQPGQSYVVSATTGALDEHWEDVSEPVEVECSSKRNHVQAFFVAQPRRRTKEVPSASYWLLLAACIAGAAYTQRSWLLPLVSASRQQAATDETDTWGSAQLPNSRTGTSSRRRRNKKSKSRK